MQAGSSGVVLCLSLMLNLVWLGWLLEIFLTCATFGVASLPGSIALLIRLIVKSYFLISKLVYVFLPPSLATIETDLHLSFHTKRTTWAHRHKICPQTVIKI